MGMGSSHKMVAKEGFSNSLIFGQRSEGGDTEIPGCVGKKPSKPRKWGAKVLRFQSPETSVATGRMGEGRGWA